MILRLKREGYAHRKIAEIIGRDHSTITKFLKRYDERILNMKDKLDVSIIDF
jgi:IS30 family transposase